MIHTQSAIRTQAEIHTRTQAEIHTCTQSVIHTQSQPDANSQVQANIHTQAEIDAQIHILAQGVTRSKAVFHIRDVDSPTVVHGDTLLAADGGGGCEDIIDIHVGS